MTSQNAEITNIDWEEVILLLHAFTRSLVKGKGWFRGKKATTLLKGKEIDDYVFGAIEKYLRNPEKHDPSRGSLIDYLKFNLIRSMVSNDLVSAENRTSSNLFSYSDESDDNSTDYLDSILPQAEVYFDQEIDYHDVMKQIELEVKKDPIVENIFLGICVFGLKRREIIEEFNITEKEYDNGIRRLNTIRDNVAKKHDLKAS